MALLTGTSLTGCIDADAEVGADESAVARRTAETAPSSLATGLVGVARAQEAQLHVTMHPPEPVVPPEPVQLLLSLVGEDGALVAQRSVTLAPGRSALLRAPGPADGRRLVRAAISFDPAGGNPPDDNLGSGGIQATLEIVDVATGSSQVVVDPVVLKGFNPQPEPPALIAN